MARTGMVWGIDVGQCALKALRCRAGDNVDRVVVTGFDYIEYPKILSQPGSDPNELIGEALKTFLSRNSVRGDRVAISVSGQSGLARFIKLPPVEAKKIPDIVRYEARQQIPFDLNDVIWDYQRMGGGSEEEGFALETEIGLFAMKRDAVFRALEPFQKAGIELDFVQLTPLALYNFVLFDQLRDLPPIEEYDPENPPESVVVVSLGTDSTDLVVTNGFRVWQRSVPLGGNHFTKALTKELKLTFAKAEHLKRNAASAQDPKAIFQAMRPVFNDLLTELQRSLGFFSNIDRHAKIGRIVALGNAFKLPGLRRFLSQSLGYDIQRVEAFRGLEGPEIINAPSFKENILSFGVCYGLALQGLSKGGLKTNLLPKQIVRDRLIREKKPWAVAAAAALLFACSLSFAAYSMALATLDESKWSSAEGAATSITNRAASLKDQAEKTTGEFLGYKKIGDNLVGNVEKRVQWLELLMAIDQALPEDDQKPPPADIRERNELHVSNIDCQQIEDLAPWFLSVKQWYMPLGEAAANAANAAGGTPLAAAPGGTLPAAAPAGPAPTPAASGAPAAPLAGGVAPLPGGEVAPPLPGGVAVAAEPDPSGKGWLISIQGKHYHNKEGAPQSGEFVRKTLMRNLVVQQVKLPTADGKTEVVSMKDLGVSHPVLINPGRIEFETIDDPNPIVASQDGTGGGSRARLGPAPEDGGSHAGKLRLPMFRFNVQFVWKPTSASERHAVKKESKQ